MSRCVMVLGTGRSGTSMVAGALHALGVNMGKEFVEDKNNQWGSFEDREFFEMTREVIKGRGDYAPLIAEREEQEIWGIKDPALAHTAPALLPMLYDPRIIVVHRSRRDTVNSCMKAYLIGRTEAERWHDELATAVAAALLSYRGPVLDVWFEDILEDPTTAVSKIAEFVLGDIEPPTAKQFSAAVKHIRQKPRQRPQSWGNLAIGVRHSKFCPAFFTSWSTMLSGGLRNGDTILKPECEQPAHWAATALAKAFLKTDKDTLFLVDDDMVFKMGDLHRLRENRANWEYDVVMPMAMRRSLSDPSPVIMRHMGEAPFPHDTRGDHFEHPPKEVIHNGVQEVDAVGLAFTLIRRHVLEAMVDPERGLDNTYDFFTYGPGMESDDIPFSRRCRALGFRMAIDSSVKLGHVTQVPLTYEMWMEFLKDA